ncbi:MAG: hypothetical protein IT165_03650 [Bryobacterales bacterium]|nr:hypothetical protein [Bryobacterales bacterium]
MKGIAVVWAAAGVVPALAWQVPLWLAAIRLARFCGFERGGFRFAAGALSLSFVLGSLCASALTMLRLNSMASYLILGMIFAWIGRRERPGDCVGATPATGSGSSLYVLGLLAVFLPLITQAMHPVLETDSAAHLSWVLGWSGNRIPPYEFANQYCAFWELLYVPILVLTRGDGWFWLVTIQALALIGLLVAELSRLLNLPAYLALPHLLFPHYWNGPSGLPTLKNDMIYAAGFLWGAVLLAEVAERRRSRQAAAIAIFATSFLLCKYSGTALAAFLFVFVAWRWRRIAERPVRDGLVWAVVATAASGIFYIKNIVLFHNPLFPFQIRLFGLELPGAPLPGTSLVAHFWDKELWAQLIPPGSLRVGGALMPFLIGGSVVLCCLLMAEGASALSRGLRISPQAAWSPFLLTGWLIYVNSIYSAGATAGRLDYVYDCFNSLRYVEGQLAVSEVLIAGWLASRLGSSAVVAFASLVAGSRLTALWSFVGGSTPYPALACIAAGLVWVLCAASVRWFRRAILPVLATSLLIASPLVRDRMAQVMRLDWQPVLYQVREASGSVFLVPDPLKPHLTSSAYRVMGKRMDQPVAVGGIADLEKALRRDTTRPQQIVHLMDSSSGRNPASLQELRRLLFGKCYTEAGVAPYAVRWTLNAGALDCETLRTAGQ